MKATGRPVYEGFFDSMRSGPAGQTHTDRVAQAFSKPGGYKDHVISTGGRAIVINSHPVLGRHSRELAEKRKCSQCAMTIDEAGLTQQQARQQQRAYTPIVMGDSAARRREERRERTA